MKYEKIIKCICDNCKSEYNLNVTFHDESIYDYLCPKCYKLKYSEKEVKK